MNTDQTLTLIQVILGALIGYLGIRELRDKNRGDAFSGLTSALKTAGMTISDLMTMVSEVPQLRQRIEDLENELSEYKIGVGLLLGQLIKNGIKPTWTPPGVEVQPRKSSGDLLR